MQKLARIKPHTKPRQFSRRAALKMGLIAAFMAACRAQQHDALFLETRTNHHYMGEVDTSHGKLIPVIENWPNIKTLEMSWAKEKGRVGKLRNTAILRGPDYSDKNDDRLRVRSRIHTHPVLDNTVIKARLCSIVSPHDLRNTIRKALEESNPEKMTRLLHIIPISFEGKVMGFFTIRVGKKLAGLMQNKLEDLQLPLEQMQKINEEKREFLKNMDTLDVMRKKYDNGVEDVDQFFREYNEIITALQKSGLQIRVTPKNGYVFKDGYFQRV